MNPAVPWGQAWRFWLKLGFISFGGPAGQIALMHAEIVQRQRWVSEQRFLHALNYCMVLPGPEAQQLATYLGWLMHRTWGGIVAGVLFVLPSWFILVALSYVYVRYGQLPWVAAVFASLQPAVVAVVAVTATRLARRTLQKPWKLALAVLALGAVLWGRIDFPWLVLVAALVGVGVGRWRPGWLDAPISHAQVASQPGAASPATAAPLIADDSPLPAHALWQGRRALHTLLLGVMLALVPLLMLMLHYGSGHVLTQMGWFFSKAALVTFGGAYAVLPYVQQEAVQVQGWLSAAQMMDGMALGETTPGPLIMIVAFVGFLGGWSQQALGPEALWAGAWLASAVATFFTFLPSFVFILVGGPWVEATRGRLGFNAPLQAIGAVVVGVMAQLGLQFGQHALWPAGLSAWPDGWALFVLLVALALLVWRRASVAHTVLLCGLLGAVAHLLRV